MSAERVFSYEERSRRLPPLEAWKRPDKWVDLSTGLPRRDVSRLVLDTDERGLVNPHQVMEHVTDVFFWRDYDWPFDPDDQQTRPDDHHFYYDRKLYTAPISFGDEIPKQFRELPVSIGRMPRQLHNAIHDFTLPPLQPERQVMKDYVDSYELARTAFVRQLIRTRQEVDGAFIESLFRENFHDYSIAAELAEREELLGQEGQRNEVEHLLELAGKLGHVATKKYYNFTPILQAA